MDVHLFEARAAAARAAYAAGDWARGSFGAAPRTGLGAVGGLRRLDRR
ncbi:hypothetical protein [Streptomyces sp. DHE17-7]|nr:hypothetical protein [Streptomyces sp. DHE17-7]